jgi:hypothetical protein
MVVQRTPVFYFDACLRCLGLTKNAAVEGLLLPGWANYSFKIPYPIWVLLLFDYQMASYQLR